MKGNLTHEAMKRVLPDGRKVGKEYETHCPLCNHGHLRLFGEDGIKCMNGCETKDVVAWIKTKIAPERSKKCKPSEEKNYTGFTLEEYCKMKCFSQLGLQVFYGSDPLGINTETRAGLMRTLNGKPVVQWPYMDADGKVLAVKIRKSYDSHDTYFDPKDPHIPYGLWLYTNTGVQPEDLVLCEGESNQQTLTLYNIPALGISGSQGWRPEYADIPLIKNAERIFVLQDPDEGGQQFVDKISQDLRVYPLALSVKDVSELHTKAPMDGARTNEKGKTIPAVTNPCRAKSAFLAVFEAAVDEALTNEPDEAKKNFRYTDTGNAERLVHHHGANFRWLTDEEVFVFWNGQFWEKNKSGNVLLPVTKEIVRTIPDEKWQYTSESAGKRKAMIELTKGESAVLTHRDTFDRNAMLLNVRNGTIDLETQNLREFCREDYLTKRAPVEYDAFAACPKFRAFLDRIFASDEDLIHFIVKALGYSLTGSAREQCFFLCHGTGANGKSTLFEVFRGLLGADYTASAGFSTFVEKKNQDASGYDIARLPGRRMVTTTEPSKSSRLNEELLKLVTGNEVITTRQIYGVPFDFKPECKLWFAMNEQPKISGTDEGIWRRVRYIPFAVQIPASERIQGYQDHLIQEEGPGILNLLLEGTAAWLKEGLKEPSAVRKATTVFRNAQDVLSGFFDEYCVHDKNSQHVKAGLLYDAYKQWAETYGEIVLRSNEFFAEVSRRGYTRRMVHGGVIHYFGLTLRSQPSEMNDMEVFTTIANDN
jgi:P4 family phage/plasmid primase-like protien